MTLFRNSNGRFTWYYISSPIRHDTAKHRAQIIGGLHLAGPELQPRIQPTIAFLAEKLRPSPTYILPMHCSGFAAKTALEEVFGEGCVPAGVGVSVDIKGTEAGEEMVSKVAVLTG